MSRSDHKKMIIIGAGLVGSAQALFLRKRGYEVALYERRSDMRLDKNLESGRSINLILTVKGIKALERIGIAKEVIERTVPVYGRMMHSVEGELTYQPYGKDQSECNYSVSRSLLNKFLMTKAEEAGVEIFFEHQLEEINFEKMEVHFDHLGKKDIVRADIIFGTDGAGSQTRKALMNQLQLEDIDFNDKTEMLDADYKELYMPACKDGKYPLEKHALHIWPRGSHMLMALPNLDGSFTMTLYLPKGESPSFEELNSHEEVKNLFEKYYSTSIPLMPDYQNDFFENQVGRLGTVRCYPWHYENKLVLMGDASHAIVPFFGQGMNSGLLDCLVLDDLLDSNDWEEAFSKYSEYQKANGDAIANMALDNFIEMKDRVGQKDFLLKKQVEQKLSQHFPGLYCSRYRLVIYTTVDYFHAEKIGEIQEEILGELCDKLDDVEEIDLIQAESLIKEKLVPYYEENNIQF